MSIMVMAFYLRGCARSLTPQRLAAKVRTTLKIARWAPADHVASCCAAGVLPRSNVTVDEARQHQAAADDRGWARGSRKGGERGVLAEPQMQPSRLLARDRIVWVTAAASTACPAAWTSPSTSSDLPDPADFRSMPEPSAVEMPARAPRSRSRNDQGRRNRALYQQV